VARAKEHGVYAIENTLTGTMYIGSSVDLRARMGRHRVELRRGVHKNPHLQRAWDAYGATAFTFSVMERTERDRTTEVEQTYLDDLAGSLYNIALDAKAIMRGRRMSEETKRKIGKANAQSLKGKKIPEDVRRKLSEANKGKNLGRRLTPEHRKKLSEAKKGKSAWWNKRPKTEEEKRKISETKRRKAQTLAS
jgi:group I intron endonuclease